jgi:uncharacterized membrane protein
MFYVPNRFSKTVSVIDGSIDKVVALYIPSGTKCIAEPNKGFEFSSWIENLNHNSTIPLNTPSISNSPLNSFLSTLGMKPNDTSATFDITRYGTFTANFKAIPPPIPPEYWIPLYGIIVSSIVGWSIPSIIGWIKSKRQVRRVNQYHKKIYLLYVDDNKLDENDIKTLNTLKINIKNAYAKGKISDLQYSDLKNEISIFYEEAYKNRIDSLNGKVDREKDMKLLDALKDDITYAYAKGKITEQHYNLLKEKIPNYKDTG